ncbi:hypothetical protein F5Y04DRAFT_223755 [Hypomontagnella monticulosa]|nr:hypothetical protein F5Y04DRAFT_223755 [Hypomontagnella monticulosa]
MRFMLMLLLGALSSAAPLSSTHAISPDAVDFSSFGDTYKRNAQSTGRVAADVAYKRSIKSPEEVDFDLVGDTY